jgi:hypothetical protein
MSDETPNTHLNQILNLVENVASVGSMLVPQYRAYLLLGATVARQFPSLFEDIKRLLDKDEPTQDEKIELWRKLRALQRPESIE